MYALAQPKTARLDALAAAARELPFNYAEVGLSRGSEAPAGYRPNRGGGRVDGDLASAKAALLRLAPFDLGWLQARGQVAPGEVVTVCTRVLGVWTAQSCRVLYVDDDPTRLRWGYGTVRGHAMAGEERFEVRQEGAEVRFEVFSYSRPATAFSWLTLPVVRHLQRRFAADSAARMARC